MTRSPCEPRGVGRGHAGPRLVGTAITPRQHDVWLVAVLANSAVTSAHMIVEQEIWSEPTSDFGSLAPTRAEAAHRAPLDGARPQGQQLSDRRCRPEHRGVWVLQHARHAASKGASDDAGGRADGRIAKQKRRDTMLRNLIETPNPFARPDGRFASDRPSGARGAKPDAPDPTLLNPLANEPDNVRMSEIELGTLLDLESKGR
eukprot:2217189-Heterocapsa_arctica.AAC.1